MVARGDLGVEIPIGGCRHAEAPHPVANRAGRPSSPRPDAGVDGDEPAADAGRGHRRRERRARRHRRRDAVRGDRRQPRPAGRRADDGPPAGETEPLLRPHECPTRERGRTRGAAARLADDLDAAAIVVPTRTGMARCGCLVPAAPADLPTAGCRRPRAARGLGVPRSTSGPAGMDCAPTLEAARRDRPAPGWSSDIAAPAARHRVADQHETFQLSGRRYGAARPRYHRSIRSSAMGRRAEHARRWAASGAGCQLAVVPAVAAVGQGTAKATRAEALRVRAIAHEQTAGARRWSRWRRTAR